MVRSLCVFGITFILLGFSLATGAEIDSVVKKQAKKHGIKLSRMSIVVGDEGTNKPEYKLNEEVRRVPASITKFIVGGAALSVFGQGHQFMTQIYIDGKVEKNRLKGDLIIKGGGDPSFTSERMWYLVNEFRRTGITKIDGAVIVDDSLFDGERFHSGRSQSRVDRAYDAPIGALSFNWNSVNVIVRPADKTGAPPKVYLDPENDFVQLENKAKTSVSKNTLNVDRKKGIRNDKIVVRGAFPKSIDEKVIYKNISQPDLWAGYNLISFLSQRGITVKGTVASGKTPSTAKLVAESPGATMSQLVRMMMKFSNNFIAEMLTKQIDVETGGAPGSINGGLDTIKGHLKDNGVDHRDLKISSVSGLSRSNKFKAVAFWNLINSYAGSFDVGPELTVALPISGVDGTLKSRMTNLRGRVRAKTGLLTGVVSLAGYYENNSNKRKSFVIIYNGSKPAWKAQRFIDDLLENLVKQ